MIYNFKSLFKLIGYNNIECREDKSYLNAKERINYIFRALKFGRLSAINCLGGIACENASVILVSFCKSFVFSFYLIKFSVK